MKMPRPFLKLARKKKQHSATGKSRRRSVLAGSVAVLATSAMSLMAPSGNAASISWDAGSTTDFLWNTITNWNPDGLPTSLDDLTFLNSIPNPGLLPGNASVITLGAGEFANSLYFQNNYTLTGGSLTLSSGAVRVDSGSYASILSTLSSTSGFTMAGGGTVLLGGTNTISGLTTIEQGSVVINNGAALGSDSSAIIINGFSNRGVQGGQLVLNGTITPGTIQGFTFARSIALSGRGPATDGAALLSIGNNTFSGNLYGSSLGETRFGSAFGTATVTGNINMTSTNNNLVLVGNGNFLFSGQLGAGTNANAASLIKTGSGTLILSNNSNNVLGRWEVQGGTIRVSTGAQLGNSARTADTLQANGGGGFEIRTDAGNTFAGFSSNETTNSTLFFLDRNIAGTGSVNQSVSVGNVVITNNQTGTINGRNGVNLIVPTLTIAGTANGTTLTWNSGGGNLLTMGTFSQTNGGTTQTVTFNGSGDALVTGNASNTGGTTPVFNKSTTGMLTVLGNWTSATSAQSIANGTVSMASLAATAVPTAGLNIGLGGTSGVLNYIGTGGGALYGGAGAAETSAAPIRINNTTVNGALWANQTSVIGSTTGALSLSGITTTGAGVKTFYFGGANALDNTISSAIADNGGALSIGKTGTGTWVFSNLSTTAASNYSGTTIITGGTLKLTSAASLTGGLTFTADTSAAAGWTGFQTAGGTLQFNNSGALTFTGALTPTAGEGNISLGSTGTLTFTPTLGTRAVGAGLNFTPGAGAIKFTTAVTGTNGIVGGFATINGTDFVTSVAAAGSVAPPTYTPGGASFDSTVTVAAGSATKNYLSSATQATPGVFAANSLKLSTGSTLTLGGNLTITTASATSMGGILFDNSGGAGGITGNGITTSVASQELFFYTGGSTPANAFTVGSNILNNTSTAVTKSGLGTLVLSGAANAFTGNLTVNEGILKASGANTNILGVTTTVGNITTIRQLGTIDINGAGSSIVPYGTATAIPTVSIGALTGGGSTSPVSTAITTLTSATTNSNVINVFSAAGLAVGQTVTETAGEPGIGGYPVITAISGTAITLSAPVTIANGLTVAFSKQVTSGATITNSGSASAISLGATTGVSTGVGLYSGLIQDGAGATTVIVNGTSARVQSLTGFNTYTGATIISGGATLRATNLANGGVASSIGASSNAASNLVFNNGVLQYSGGIATMTQNTSTPSVNIDRLFTIAGAATIDSSGTVGNNFLTASAQDNAALVFSNTGAVSYVGTTAAARVLTLTGTSIGDNEVDLQLVNNGSTTNALSITKGSGTGLWILGNATNSYTGLTTINAGQLRAQDGTSLPTLSPLFFTGGVLETSGTFSRNLLLAAPTATSAAGGVWWSTGGGFAASNAPLTVNLNSGGTLVWAGTGASAGFVVNAQPLVLGSTTSLFDTTFQNPIDLNAAAGAVTRTITVNDNTSTGADYSVLSGVISNSTPGNVANLVINANAPTYLIGANTYNGTTNIAAGNVFVTSLGNSGTAGPSSVGLGSAATTAAIVFGNTTTTGGTLTYVGAGETSDRALTSLSTTGGITIDASGSGPLVLTGTFTNSNAAAAAKTLSLNGLNVDFNTITSTLTDNTGGGGGALTVTKNGGGTWVLTGNNTYTGPTNVSGGILGASSDTALGVGGAIVLGNGQLMAVGGDRTFANPVTGTNNTTTGFIGSNSITFNGVASIASAGANGFFVVNNVAPGKSVTFNNGYSLLTNANITSTFAGSGATVINGAITQTNNAGLTFTGYSAGSTMGSLTFGGSGTNTITGTFTQSAGMVNVNRTGAFTSYSNYGFNAGYLQNISGTALTGANALIPALLTTGANAGQPGIFNVNGTLIYLQGTGAAASMEIAGQFNNAGAANRTIYNNLTGGAQLVLSGTTNLSSDATARVFTMGGTGDTAFTGVFSQTSAAPVALIGGTFIKNATGDFNIAPTSTLNAPVNGNLVVGAGTVTFNQTNTQGFSLQKIDVLGLGALNIDYNTNGVTTSVGANSGAYRTINLAGGTLNFTANSATGTNETLGALQLAFASANLPAGPTGGGTINFINGGASASSLTFGQLNFSSIGGSLNLVASSLGTTNKIFIPGLLSTSAVGINPRVTVNGTDYATSSANGIVAYTGYLTGNNLDNTQTLSFRPDLDNVNLTATPTFTGATVTGLTKTVDALKISGNGVNVGSGTPLFQLTLNSGGVLATGTGDVISAPVLGLGAEGVFTVASGADLTISSAISGTVATTKAGAGMLVLSGPQYTTSSWVVNGGTVKMSSGASLLVQPTATIPTLDNLHANKGGTFDVNGINQFVGSLNNNDGLGGGGGTVDNTNAGTARLYVTAGGNFGGVVQNTGGALTLYKSGNNTLALTSNSTYTGATNIYGGTFALQDGGRLSGTTAVNLNFGTLQFLNTLLLDASNRINPAAPINMMGGTLRIDGAETLISQQGVGAVSALSGQNTISANVNGAGGAFLTLASLSRSTGATVNFTGSSLGSLFNNTQSGRIVIGGQAAGFVGGWATTNGTEFANYITAVDPSITPATAQGITPYQLYVDTADTTWTSADNVKLANNTASNPAVYTLGGSRTINSINIQSTTNPITVNNTALILVSGGFLSNGVAGSILAGGTLTAGSGGTAELFINDNVNTTITSQITNNGAGVVSVVKALGGNTTLSPTVNNTYGGTTTVNSGTLTIGSGAGITVIPNDLIVNNGAVTFTQAQQIAAGKNLTINGSGGNVTLVGSTLGSNVLGTVAFMNNGGITTPQITGGWLQTATINSTNDNLSTTPTIASVLDLNGSSTTVTTSGLSPNDLNITGIIQSVGTAGVGGGQLIKNGTGSLVLSGVNTFGGGVALNNGTVILNTSAAALGTGALAMADGTTLMSGTASVTPLNTVNVNGNISLGGPVAGNNINLGGTVALGGTSRTVTVASPLATATLSGLLTGTAALNKAGLGTLALTGGTLNYTAGINVNAGFLSLDQTLASFSGPIAVAAGATVNLNVGTAGSIGVSINPAGFPFAITGAGQVTKTGTAAVSVYGNLNYTGPTTVQAGSLLLSPNAVTNAAPQFNGSSMVNLGAPLVGFGLDNIGATGAIAVGGGVTPVNFLARDTFISTTRNGDFASTLNLGGAVTRSAGATGIFNFLNNVTFQPSANDSIITSNQILVGGSTGVMDQGIYITSGNIGNPVLRTDYAYHDAAGFVRQTAYGVDPGTYYSAGVAPVTATSGSFKIVGSVAPAVNFVAGSGVNTFQLGSPNSDLTLKAGSNVINGILRTAAGASASGLLINGNPYFATFMTNVQGGDIANGGKELVVRVDNAVDWLTISSTITGAGDFTKVGSGSLVIGGSVANSYAGNTNLLGSATVYLNKTGGVAAIPGNVTIGDTGNALTVQLGLLNNYSISASSSPNTGIAGNNQIATSSIVTFNSSSTLSLNGSSQTLAGIQTLSGSPIVQNGLATGDASSTLTINNSSDFNLGAGSTIRDNAAAQYANLKLVKQGGGKLTVGILANTGGVDVQGGVLALGANSSPGQVAPGTGAVSFGTGYLNVASGATVDLNGLDLTVDYLSGSGVITNSGTAGKTVTLGNLNNTNMLTGANMDASAIWSGVIADGTSGGTIVVQKRGAGTQTITTAQDFSAGLAVLGGTLVLDMSGLANPNNIVRSSNGLNLAGNLTIKGAATGTSSQLFAGTLTNAGTTVFAGASEVLGNANGGTSLTIDLGGFTRGANNATVNFTSATGVTYKTTGLTTVAGYATWNGVDWAIGTAGVLGQYSGYTTGLPTATGAAATNYVDTTAGVTLTAGVALNSLKLAPTTTQTIALGTSALTFTTVATTGPGGLLFDGTLAASTISGGAATGITGSVASTDFVVITNHTGVGPGNALTINSVIGGNLSTVTKAGTDKLILGGANTFAGVLRINEGTLEVATATVKATAQPLGKGSITLGGNAKTGTLAYTGATTSIDHTIALGDGGIGQFSLTSGTASTLTLSGIISGGGGLTVLTPTTTGSGLVLTAANTYLGQTVIQSGAKVSLNGGSLGATGTIANGTVIQSGGVLEIQDNRNARGEVITINGSGIGGTGAITYSGATTDENNLNFTLTSLILGSNSTIASTGGKQIAIGNGFIQGNGNTLTVGGTNFIWFTNETIDNVPTISVSSSVVIEQMTMGGGSGQTLVMTGAGKQVQLRTAVVDRAITYTGASGSIATSTRGGDNFITQDVTLTNAATTTLTLTGAGNGTITINGNILRGGAGSVPVTRSGGFVVLGGTANTFQGGINSTAAGTLKLMPVSPGAGAVTNPFATANAVTFTGGAAIGAAYPLYNMTLALDNSKAGGNISQTFGALTAPTAGLSPTIQLNNATGNSLSLIFASYARAVGTEMLLGITGAYSTPSATNQIDFAGGLTAASQAGTFWNGSSFVIRDAGNFLRPINYVTDTGANLVNASVASFTNTGAATNHSNIASGGSVTAQGTAQIGTLAFGAGATNLTLSAGSTLTLGTAGVLKTGGGTSTISGGTALQLGVASTTDSVIRVDSVTDNLIINSPISFFNTTGQTLSKFGQGRLTLGGTSSMTGTMNVDQGTVRLTSNAAFGTLAANTITMAVTGGALELDGAAAPGGGITIANNIVPGITGNDSMGWMRQNTGTVRNISGNNTITGSISSTGYHRMNSDAGTLTLTNVASAAVATTFGGVPSTPGAVAGNILITGRSGDADVTHDGTGTLTFRPTVAIGVGGKTLGLQGGTTVLDFTNMTTATNMLTNTAILNMQGSIFQILGKATGATAQTFATFTQREGLNRISANVNGGSGVTLTLGAYASPAVTAAAGTAPFLGSIDFLPATNVTYSATAGGAVVNNNGIMAPSAIYNGFATAGTDWAVVNGTTILNYVTNGGTYTPLPGSGSTATTNYNLTGSQTVTATQALNSLKLDSTAGAFTLTVNSLAQLNTNAFLLVGANDVTLSGAGTVGSTAANNYFHIQGSGNLLLNTTITDNSATASVGLVFAGTGTGGVTIGATGAINFASNTNTDSIYFEGGVPGTSRNIINNGAINFNSKGSIDIGRTGTDSVVLTNNGVISMTAGTLNVGSVASAYGSYVQSSPTSSFTATGANVQFAVSTLANITDGGISAGSASFNLSGGTFAVGGTSGAGNFTVFGGNGSFAGTQSGGVITLNRPGSIALFLAEEGTYGASSSYTQTGGTLSVNGSTIIGARTGAIGSFTVSGSATANFYQGLTLGLQDYAQGTFTQNGGNVNIGTGSNISDTVYLRGDNTIDLVLGYNQTTNPGAPSTTQGTYNLNGGTLRANGIATGQGNGYTSSNNAAASTFTDNANVFTTTGGGTANFNWGAGTLSPFDAALTIGPGVNVTLTAAGATVNTDDAAGVSRLVTFNTPITGNFGITETGGGILLLTSVNTYTGDTNIVSGILRPGVSNAIPSGSGYGNIILNSGVSSAGTLGLNGLSISINGLIGDSTNAVLGQVVNNVNGTNVTLTVGNNDQTSTFNGLIKNNNNAGTGTIALTKTGTGSLTLGGANTYTGATNVNDGALYVNGSLSTASAVTVAAGKIFGGSGSAGAVGIGAGGTINPGLSGTGTGDLVLTGLNFSGTGTVNFRNIQDGVLATTINAGTLVLGGGAGSVSVNVGAGSGAWINGTNYPLINYTGGTIGGAGFGGFTLVSPGTIPGLSTRQTAALVDTGLAVSLMITGASPRWSGFDTTTSGLAETNWLPANTGVTNWTLIGAGTPTYYINPPGADQVTFDDTIAVGGTPIVTISSGDVTPSAVTVNNSTALTYTFTGVNGIAGSTGLLKSNNGTLNINNANSFTGGVFLNGGKIVLGNSMALGATTNVVAFGAASNATLSLNGQTVTIGGLTGDATATVENGAGTASTLNINLVGAAVNIFGGVIQDGTGGGSLAAALSTSGSGTLILTGTNSYTGGTSVGAGSTLQIGNNSNSGSIVGNVTDNGSLVFNRSDSVNYPGAVTGGGAVTVSTGTVVLNGGSLGNSGGTTVNSLATLQVGNSTLNGSVGNVLDNGTLVFAFNATPQTYASTVTGAGAVTVSTGTVILTGGFNNSGAITVNPAAALQVGDTVTNGTLGGNVTDNGMVDFNLNATPLTYANSISGSGTVQVNNGTLVLTSGNTYAGPTTVANNATLQIGTNGTGGSITSDVFLNGVNSNFVINRGPLVTSTASYGGNITGTGSLNLTGKAIVILSGTGNTFSGGTNIQQGTLRAGATNALSPNSMVTVGSPGLVGTLQLFGLNQTVAGIATAGTATSQIISNGQTSTDAVLTLSGATTSTYGGQLINGSTKKLGITLTGGNTLVLTGLATANTYTGVTAVQDGTLKIGATGAGNADSLVVLGASGTNGALDVNAFNGSVEGISVDPGAIAANQIVGNSSGSATANSLTLTPLAATTYTFGGVIQDVIGANNGQTTGITLNGANATTSVEILTGTNTYSGGTTLTQGVLQLGNGGTTGTLGTGATTIASTATLLYNRSNTYTLGSTNGITGAGAITLTGGGTLDTGTTDGLVNTTGVLNFGSAAGATVLGNLAVNGNATVGSMVVQTNSAIADTLTIASGKTFTITGAATIGTATNTSTTVFNTTNSGVGNGSLSIGGGLTVGVAGNSGTNVNATFTNTNLSVTGAVSIGTNTTAAANTQATVAVTGGSATFSLGATAMSIGTKSGTTVTGTVPSASTLDLSGATSVNITGAAGSSIVLGANTGAGGAAGDQFRGVLKLSTSGTNTVAATTITLGNSTTSGISGTQGFIVLGNAANNFSVDTFTVGGRKSQAGGTPSQASDLVNFAGSGGTLTLGGLAGTKADLRIGYNDPGTTSSTSTGVMDLTGGTFNGTLGTVTIGYINGTNVSGGGIGTLTMAAGTVTADQIRLAEVTGGVAATTAGTLNLNGGTVTLASAGLGINGGSALTGAATVNLAGATLDMSGTNIGAAAPNTVTLNAQSGTLKNLAQLNNGAALNKTTGGTLIMDGANTYTGQTNVTAGTVQVNSATGLGTGTGVAGDGTSVSAGATLNLNAVAVGNERVVLNGTGVGGTAGALSATGTASLSGPINLATASTIATPTGTDMLALSGPITGGATAHLTQSGSGMLTVSGTSNTYTGNTNIGTGSTLAVTGSLSGTTQVNNSGTLILNSTSNANNIVNTAAAYQGNTGSSLQVANTTSGITNTFASMTLSGSSTLDFGAGSSNSTLQFNSINPATSAALLAATFTLSINNWTGTPYDPAGPFTDNLSTTQNHFNIGTTDVFGNGTVIPGISFTGGLPGMQVSFGSQFEIVPVPEPATTALIGAVALCALIGYRERRRFTGIRNRLARK